MLSEFLKDGIPYFIILKMFYQQDDNSNYIIEAKNLYFDPKERV
jgi:hypothetical protein